MQTTATPASCPQVDTLKCLPLQFFTLVQTPPLTSCLPFPLRPLLSAPPSFSLESPIHYCDHSLGNTQLASSFAFAQRASGPLFSMPALEQLGPAGRNHTIGQTCAPQKSDH